MVTLKSTTILLMSIAALGSTSYMVLTGGRSHALYLESGRGPDTAPPLHQLGETPFTSIAARPRAT